MLDSIASLFFWIFGFLLLLGLGTAAAVAGYLYQRRRKRRRARLARPSRPAPAKKHTEHPIVLAHGWLGFDTLALPGIQGEYFRGVRQRLEREGNQVFVPRVSPVAGIRTRAEQLAEQLERIDAERLNIIAHSMGGLDARYAISRLGLAPRVASLTTLGTPHFGTPLADQSLVLGRRSILRRMMAKLGADVDGVYDLTIERMLAFNAATPDLPGVHYLSYVGWVNPHNGPIHRLLQPGFRFLSDKAGHNDGIVPTSSQRWGEVRGLVQADHWAQIGWAPGLDTGAFYTGLAQALAREGH